ncbi:MAG: hypothetical protein AB1348_08055 [Nitrospirota bacterium]
MLIYLGISIVVVVFVSQAECGQVLDSKQIPVHAVVNTIFQTHINPAIIGLHEVGHKNLLSEGCVTFSITSNTSFTVYFRTANPDGNIRNDSSYLETFYIILPSGSPQPSINDPRWMSGAKLNSYTETSNSRDVYGRDIYIKAIKDNPPYGMKDYTDTVTITAKDKNGNESIMQFQIIYRIR